MRKIFLLLLFVSLSLHAYSDNDFDGVGNASDKCPNTPFTDLVDIYGCSKISLLSPHNFDIIIGTSYSDSDYQTLNKTDTLSSTIQIDYFYKNFSFEASSSYFTTQGDAYSDTGLNDTFLGASYQVEILSSVFLRVGVGALLATYKTALQNNHTDYLASLNLSYKLDNFTLFGGYSHTLMNDTDTVDFKYQNSNAYNLGLGHYVSTNFYVSGAYNLSDSIYTHIEKIQTLSTYAYYSFDKHYFTTLSYAYGLSSSASKNYVSVNLGYTF